jgi:hypothetical protein
VEEESKQGLEATVPLSSSYRASNTLGPASSTSIRPSNRERRAQRVSFCFIVVHNASRSKRRSHLGEGQEKDTECNRGIRFALFSMSGVAVISTSQGGDAGALLSGRGGGQVVECKE